MAEVLERIVQMSPAWGKRNTDPSKNYGIHGVELRMVLKGPAGAVQFLLFTGWQLPHVAAEFKAKGWASDPNPADLGYHSRKPMYEGQCGQKECPYIDGAECFYDGSGLNAEPIFDVLLREGSDGVWRELENYYHATFGEASGK